MDGLMSLGYSSGFPGPAAMGLPQNVPQPITSGSQFGAPGTDTVQTSYAGSQGTGSQNAVAYGKSRAGMPPTHQPIFWIVALMVVAVIMLGHVANLEVK